jgi:hypothetical protein
MKGISFFNIIQDNHAYIPGFGALMHDPVMPKVIGRHLTKALGLCSSTLVPRTSANRRMCSQANESLVG